MSISRAAAACPQEVSCRQNALRNLQCFWSYEAPSGSPNAWRQQILLLEPPPFERHLALFLRVEIRPSRLTRLPTGPVGSRLAKPAQDAILPCAGCHPALQACT